MKVLIKRVFEDEKWGKRIIPIFLKKNVEFHEFYYILKNTIDMPYDPDTKFPAHVIQYPRGNIYIFEDTTVKTDKRYVPISPIYPSQEAYDTIEFMFKHFGFDYSVYIPNEKYEFNWYRRAEGMTSAVAEAQRMLDDDTAFFIMRESSKWYLITKFNRTYLDDVRATLDATRLKYKLVY